jgi:dolichol-phosphate mannosyltransferase
MSDSFETTQIAVIIPAYRVRSQIMGVISSIPNYVSRIYVVDDACPEKSGILVSSESDDSRIKVITHSANQGVGGAVMTGYQAAILDGADILVKIDGDGQMNPLLISDFVHPILAGEADYTKGNRFYDIANLKNMPTVRLIGNGVLSFLTKLSSGYWNLFDPTNGYTAIHADVCRRLPFTKISKRYFFETDMLFRLNLTRAVVVDIPMDAVYADEKSNLKIRHVIGDFFLKHLRNLAKRIFYNYYLRDLSLASIQLLTSLILTIFGITYGGYHWWLSAQTSSTTAAGTVMLAAMPTLVGVQLFLSFLGYDISSTPKHPIHMAMRSSRRVFNKIA